MIDLADKVAQFLRNRVVLALAVVALAQTAVLASMVIDRTRLLRPWSRDHAADRAGRPARPLQGRIRAAGLRGGQRARSLLEGPPPERNAAYYVVLEKKEGGAWQPVKASSNMPRETSPDRIVLKGRSTWRWPTGGSPNATVRVRYGIESYFVPQGEGKRLEDLAREKKLAALVAVDSGGNAAIKGILIDRGAAIRGAAVLASDPTRACHSIRSDPALGTLICIKPGQHRLLQNLEALATPAARP